MITKRKSRRRNSMKGGKKKKTPKQYNNLYKKMKRKRKSRRRKSMKGGNNTNSKQLVINTIIDKLPDFKVFLGKMSSIQNKDVKETIKDLEKLNKTKLKEVFDEIPATKYDEIMKRISSSNNDKSMKMRGGLGAAPPEEDEDEDGDEMEEEDPDQVEHPGEDHDRIYVEARRWLGDLADQEDTDQQTRVREIHERHTQAIQEIHARYQKKILYGLIFLYAWVLFFHGPPPSYVYFKE